MSQHALARRDAQALALEPSAGADAPLAPRVRDPRQLAQRLRGKYADRVTGHFVLPAREGRYAPLPADLREALADFDDTYVGGAEAEAIDERDATGRDRLVVMPLILGLVFVALIGGIGTFLVWLAAGASVQTALLFAITVVVITHNTALMPMGHKVIKLKSGLIEEIVVNETPVGIDELEW